MSTYTIRRRLVSIGRDYVVEDDKGQKVLFIDGKVRFARTFSIDDPSGIVLLRVREKQLCLEPTYIIKRDGVETAVVRRTSVMDAPVDEFTIDLNSGNRAEARGDLTFDQVAISRGDDFLAIVKRLQKPFLETFTLEVAAEVELPLVVAIAMSIIETDMHRGEQRGSGS